MFPRFTRIYDLQRERKISCTRMHGQTMDFQRYEGDHIQIQTNGSRKFHKMAPET